MQADVFLYGRTGTHDYFDMYIPSWLSPGTGEYREYRKNVSYIMKIRDILPEDRVGVLSDTADSFVFIKGRTVSMLCRFCHICGSDEFGRPICSTEGFVVKNDLPEEFRRLIPDMIAFMTASERTWYDEYCEAHGSELKPESEIRSEEITAGGYPDVKLGQFSEMKSALSRTRRAFSFVYGRIERSLCDYGEQDDEKISVFFCADECTEIPDETSDSEENSAADFGALKPYFEIRKTPQGKLRYRIVLCRAGEQMSTSSMAYLSYEKETASEIKAAEIFRMYRTVSEHIIRHGADEKAVKKCVPYSSESDAEYTGRHFVLTYRPPAEQKRSLLQIIKGEKLPDYSGYIFYTDENGEVKLSEVCSTETLTDDSTSRLVPYEKIMEGDS